MDFTPEELEVSPPCFLVENSQSEDSQVFRSDSARDLAILKQLTRLSTSRTDPAAGNSLNDSSLPRNCVAISCSTSGGEGGGREEGDPSRQQGDEGQQGQGGDSSGGDDGGGGDGGGDNYGGGGGGGGGEGGGGEAGGGDGDGSGGDGDDNENNDQDPSTNEEESPHSEEPSSSSDALPELIRPEAATSAPGVRVIVKDVAAARQHGSGGSVHDSSGDNYSQASTGIAGEGGDVATDVSEASTALVDEERKSTSSSSVGHKSEHGSTISSSSYHGDLSSLSSGSSLPVSPEVRKHLPLHPLLRTQSTSDTSTSSAGSKEEKVHGKVSGYKLWSLEEEPEVCSSQEDLFVSPRDHQEGVTDDSHLISPQHRSTPVDGQSNRESHPHEKSLYKQALTSTAKQRTSTPVEGGAGGFLCTPPSQGTPIDNITFQSLQFSGEPSVRETSSSSSDKVLPSPEVYSLIPALDPSSPTATDEEQVEEKTSRKEETSEKGSAENNISTDKEQSEMSRAAAELVQSFDLSQSQEKHLEKPASLRLKETLDDDKVELPLWQQKQQQEALQQASVANEKKSSSSHGSSSQGSSSDDALKGESPPQLQQWQSVVSALGTSSTSGSPGTKVESVALASNGSKEPCAAIIGDSFLDSTKDVPLISNVHEEHPKEVLQEYQLSLSPSSLIIDPFKPDEHKGKGTEESPAVIPGPTQPEMSEDMFLPVVTQESREQKRISDEPVDQPMEQENVQEDSQVMPFSLHLTQSQSDMGSQMPLETSQPMEGIQEEVAVSQVVDNAREDKPAETVQKEEVASLTKQDSSSQSILAPLVQALPSVSRAQAVNDQDMHHKQQNMEVATVLPENRAFSRHSLAGKEETSNEGVDDVRESEKPHPSPEKVAVIHPPEKLTTREESGGDARPGEHDAPDDFVQVQLSIPERGAGPTCRKKDSSEDLEKEQLSATDIRVRKPIKPRLPATIFSETSSESGAGGFHFSIPKEPLRPLICTTPPPLRPVRQDTPDSEERSSRRSIIPDVALPVVTETPGMSSQAPSSSLDQMRPQSLTVSMPRLNSPLSDSESSEPAFHFEPSLPRASTSTESLDRPQPSAPAPPRSIFSRAREAIAKSKKREMREVQNDDPFAFTAEDEAPEPIRKKPKRGSPRRTRGIDTGRLEERPSCSSEKSGDGNEQVERSQDRASTKRVREESGESPEREESEDRSKRARKEEDDKPKPAADRSEKATSEAVHYRQITRTRILTTVTTQVQREVTVSIVDKESGEVVQVLTYEEDGEPKVESQEEEKEEVNEFVETSSLDGSRVTVSARTPKRQELQQQSRSSSRIKNGKSPISKQARASDTTQAATTPRKSSSEKDSGNVGKEKREDHQSRDEPTEIPSITRQATMPVVEEEPNVKRTSSSDSSLTPGTRVLAKWLDSYFYPGVITTKQYKNGRYLVTFDDGDKRRIPRENLIIKDLLPVGQSVMAQGDGVDDFFEEGVIVGHYRDRNERGYEIQTQNGAIRRFSRSRVILSELQAAAILSSESSFNITSGSSVSIGAHSLRLRKEGSVGSSGASLHDISKSGSTGAKDTSRDTSSKDTSSSDERTRGKTADRTSPRGSPRPTKAASTTTDVTPKSIHKSASHKVKAQARRAGQRIAESESSSDEQHGATAGKRRYVRRGLSSTYGPKSPVKPVGTQPVQPARGRSPRKQMSGKEDTIETPFLPGNRNIFAGLAFLVTGVIRDKNEPEESDSESERIEFNRDHLKRQIEAGGGVVLSSFPQSQISGAECFLISHTHQRTQKYFQSLASGIPCVSHMWINDCCACNERLDYKRYLLPAGESLEEGDIVECRPRRNILGGMRVYLHGSQQFKGTWSSVLLAAGCRMVAKLPGRVDYECDVIICEDHKLPASVKHAADLLGIHIVSLEWLLQSLINGRQVPFDGHPKYDYRYKNA